MPMGTRTNVGGKQNSEWELLDPTRTKDINVTVPGAETLHTSALPSVYPNCFACSDHEETPLLRPLLHPLSPIALTGLCWDPAGACPRGASLLPLSAWWAMMAEALSSELAERQTPARASWWGWPFWEEETQVWSLLDIDWQPEGLETQADYLQLWDLECLMHRAPN